MVRGRWWWVGLVVVAAMVGSGSYVGAATHGGVGGINDDWKHSCLAMAVIGSSA